jgi:hypothetical protein
VRRDRVTAEPNITPSSPLVVVHFDVAALDGSGVVHRDDVRVSRGNDNTVVRVDPDADGLYALQISPA